jgi:hypothetical protein
MPEIQKTLNLPQRCYVGFEKLYFAKWELVDTMLQEITYEGLLLVAAQNRKCDVHFPFLDRKPLFEEILYIS